MINVRKQKYMLDLQSRLSEGTLESMTFTTLMPETSALDAMLSMSSSLDVRTNQNNEARSFC